MSPQPSIREIDLAPKADNRGRHLITAPLLSPASRLPLLLSILFFFAPVIVSGQITTGTINVRVVDPNGAAIRGVEVTAVNAETGLQRTATSDDEGRAAITDLPPGTYTLRGTALGFKSLVVERVTVGVGRRAEVEMRLDPAGIGVTTVTVGDIEEEEAREIALGEVPNLNNDLTPLLQLVPGAAAASPAALGRVIIDGKGKEQQSLRLDGLDVTPLTEVPAGDAALGVTDSLLRPNVALNSGRTDNHNGLISVRGSKPLLTTPAEEKTYRLSPFYGPGTGTMVDGVSFAGDHRVSKKWKLQFSESMRNDAFNARNYFDYEGKNGLRRSLFGLKGGAPLVEGKAFIFFGYDDILGRLERIIYESVPADALTGRGAGPLAPFLAGFLPEGTTIRDGAAPPNSDFLVARRRVRSESEASAFNARLDLPGLTGQGQTLTFRFTRQAAEFFVPDGVTGRRQRQSLVLANALARLVVLRPGGVNADTGSINPVVEHSFKFGYNETRSHLDIELPRSFAPELARSLITVGRQLPVSNLPGQLPGVPTTVPAAGLGGLARGAGLGRGFGQTPVALIAGYDLFASPLRLFEKDHTLEAGFEARFLRLDFNRLGGLTYSFADAAAMRAGTPSSVNFLADLDEPSPFNAGAGPHRARQQYYLSYFQARSNLRDNLLLTYGLRYDYFGPVSERDDRAVVIDPETGVILPPGVPFYRTKKNNFQPRVGVAYRMPSGFTLRGGAGIYSGAPRIGDLLLPIESDRVNTTLTGGVFPVSPAEVARNFIESPATRQYQPIAFARDFATPERVYRWDAMLTRTFGGPLKSVFDLNLLYTGNVGRDLPVANIANRIIRVETAADPTKPAVVVREFDDVIGGLVFKDLGEVLYRASEGRSSFHGLTVQLRRSNASLPDGTKLSRWLAFSPFDVQYTLGRSVGNVSGALASDPRDFDADYGYNALDARHTFIFSTSYQLWDEKDENRQPTSLRWGWSFSPKITARSGLPLIVRIDRPDVIYEDSDGDFFSDPAVGRRAVINTPGGGNSPGAARVPDLIAGADPYALDGLLLLDPAAFAIPAPGRFGNLRRGSLRGPGSLQVDLSVTRVLFNATPGDNDDKLFGDLKIEIFNLFNRANFNNPTAVLPNVLGTSPTGERIQPGVPFTRLAAGPFGVINAADAGRLIQFTLTFKFNEGF